jgi:hypothetical protein
LEEAVTSTNSGQIGQLETRYNELTALIEDVKANISDMVTRKIGDLR